MRRSSDVKTVDTAQDSCKEDAKIT